MRRAITALGIDYDQWRVLSRAFLRIDFASLLGAFGHKAARRSALALIISFAIYTTSGFVAAGVAWLNSDLLVGGTITATQVAFMVGASILLGHGSSLVSADDYNILGFRPVSSRTYLAVRVTTLLVHTSLIAALCGYLPVAAFLLKPDARLPAAVGALVAVAGTAVTTTLMLVLVYTWLLRVVGPERMGRVLSYAQMAAGLTIYGGIAVMLQFFSTQVATGLTLDRLGWPLVYPPAWFGSWVPLAMGEVELPTLVLASLSVLLVIGLMVNVTGRLSLGYAASLSRLATAAHGGAAGRRSSWPSFLRHETRAVALLVRSQFRHDMKFRLGVLSLLPITGLYLYLGLRSGRVVDPFLGERSIGGNVGLLQFALLFLPITLRRALVTSDAYKASWIFHTTPADRVRLVTSSRNVIAIYFLVPYLVILAGVFVYFFGHVGHALLHTLFLGWTSFLVLQGTVLTDPRLPFSMPLTRESNSGAAFLTMMGATAVGLFIYMLLTYVVYRSPVRIVLGLVALAVTSVVLDRLTRRQVRREADGFAYMG